MTIYKRPDNTIFAESAQSGEVVAFENMPRGWGVTLDSTKGIPPMEWFNFLQNRTDKAIQYILQNGITEYNTSLEYPQNAIVKSDGKLYLCLRQNTNKPLSNGAYWELLIKSATTSQSGIVQLSSSVTSTDETKASTPKATKTAHDKAVQADNNANTRVSKNGDTMSGSLSFDDNFSSIEWDMNDGKVGINNNKDYVTKDTFLNLYLRSSQKDANILLPAKDGIVLINSDLSDAISSNDSSKIASSKAVSDVNNKVELNIKSINKAQSSADKANDNANGRVSKDGDTMSGFLSFDDNFSSVTWDMNDGRVGINNNKDYATKDTFLNIYARDSGKEANISFPRRTDVVATRIDAVPAGAIMPFAGDKVPRGWLRMNNGYYNPKSFPELFSVLGYYYGRQGDKFLVPSIENRFIRGMANGLKRGQKQEDAIRNIKGQFYTDGLDIAEPPSGAFAIKGGTRPRGGLNDGAKGDYIIFDASRVVPTADENRPKSIAFPYIIKY